MKAERCKSGRRKHKCGGILRRCFVNEQKKGKTWSSLNVFWCSDCGEIVRGD